MSATLRIVAALAAVVAAVAALHEVAGVPAADMAASRLVPAMALAHGFPLYAGADEGPIIDFMYGPVAAIAFLPAALATTPSGALALAVALNAAWFFLPVAWLHRRAAPGLALPAVVLFALAVVRDPGLRFSALTIHADAPALGLAALACALLATAPRAPAAGRLAAVALAAVLAAWAKQTTAPLAGALVAFAWWRDGGRTALALVAWLAGLGAAVSAACLVAFGGADVVFNMVTLPARMPWYDEAARGRWATVVWVAGLLARLAWLPALAAAGVLAALGREARTAPTALLAVAGAVLAPVAIASAAKVGGYLNTFSVCTYFLAAAATVGLARLGARADRTGTAARAVLLAGLVALGVAVARGPGGVATAGETLARLGAWGDNPQARAFAAARAHAGEIYLPWNPLATLLAEGRLDHSEIGAWNRDLAGVPIDGALWRRWLPPRLRLLAHRPPADAFVWLPAPTARLPEMAEPAALAALPGWTVYARRVAAPSGPGLEREPHGAPARPHP